ncbi:MAG: cytochrome P450 [Caldimonas sp.]
MSHPFPADPIAAVVHPDPYPYYAELRSRGGLQRDDALGLWIATGADGVDGLLREPAGLVRPPAEPVPRFLLGTRAGNVFGALARMNDGERHVAQRARVEGLLQRIDRAGSTDLTHIADELARAWRRDGDPGALDVAIRDLPTTVIAAALGVPETERPAVVSATAAWVAGLSARADETARIAAIAAMDQLLDRLSAFGVTDNDDAAAHVAMLMQPHEATAGWIGAGVLRLARDAALRDAACNGSLDAEAFGSEVLRHDPPVQNTRRTLATDVSIGACTVRAGDSVLIVLASAERDPRRHAEPDRFRLDRPRPPSLDLGAGPHRCPGGGFALRIACAAWHALAKDAPPEAFAALADRVRWRPSANVRAPVFGAAPRHDSIAS